MRRPQPGHLQPPESSTESTGTEPGEQVCRVSNGELEAELAQLYAVTGVAAERGDQRLH